MSASVLLVVLGAYPAAARTHSPTGSLEQQGLAAFEWYRLSQVNSSMSDERLWSLRRDGFTAVYADIGEWLEAADQPESWSQRRRLRRLAGDRLQGVQFDIEPYVDPSFWDNVTRSLQAYLLTVEGIVGAYEEVRAWPGNEGLGLGFAIPFWFDGVPEAPEVEFGRTEDTITTQAAAFHLIDLLRELPEAYVLVMAYRNVASGPTGPSSTCGASSTTPANPGRRAGS